MCNLNPRSIYNKVDEFKAFIEHEEIDVAFISESWERDDLTLDKIIEIENYEVISNVNQRKEAGGKPALLVNKRKFHYENITNTLALIPWGVEAVWCILTPLNVTNTSRVQKIACCSFYCRPGSSSKAKSLLLDHICEVYQLLNVKYQKGLHFAIAGDANTLKLDAILSLSQNMNQIVTDYTRMDPPKILDPIITTLASYYLKPECLRPLDVDENKIGKASDHRIVVARPISNIDSKSARIKRTVKVRPFSQSGIEKMKDWIRDETWNKVFDAPTASEKAAIFQKTLVDKVDEIFPEKVRCFTSEDQPWITHRLKLLDRKKKRVYHKERRSEKWKHLNKQFKKEVSLAKAKFYEDIVSDLKLKKPHQWYSALKRISSSEPVIGDKVVVDEISHLSDQDQADLIANHFASIQNEFEPLRNHDIVLPNFDLKDFPEFRPSEVWLILSQLPANKATVPGDLPARFIKLFAAYLAEPLSHIINTSVKTGDYPAIYKFEISTPVPKVFPPQKVNQLRNISGLLNFDKVMEKLISRLVVSDMSGCMDPSQYGNQKGQSIQHYLVRMIHRILTVLDVNTQKESFAVIASLIDWNNAFPRQCPKLGIEAFVEMGVRPSLIPLLTSYFQDRQMSVKWHGCQSKPIHIKGGGPQGATLGILEYLAQSNKNADGVEFENKFKFIDDLTILETVNLLTVGLSSFNLKSQVPNDIPDHGQFILSENLQSQRHLNEINEWTVNQKMQINGKKSKAMIYNFSKNHQFTTRLSLDNEVLGIVESTKLLGTIIQNDLKWDQNTAHIVKKANARLVLLRKLATFSLPVEDLKIIYILYIRSLLEQSAIVWHSSLTIENSEDLERVQKNAMYIIMKDRYTGYENALKSLGLQTLSDRRRELCLRFALKCVKDGKNSDIFPRNPRNHKMKTRNQEKYKIQFANTGRLKKSPIIYMQHLLNEHQNS